MCFTRFEKLDSDLYRIADVCNVYLIVRGEAAIAIDPGRGQWLGALGDIGVKRLDWVLLTHTHRDHCAGVYELDRAVTKLAVPRLERHLVEDVESFWRTRRVNHNYNQIADFMSLPRSVPVDRSLEDFDTFEWQGVQLKVLPAPGHTPGSVTLFGELNEKRVCFVGDMIEAPGRVPRIDALQYVYTTATGAALLCDSLQTLMRHDPELLLPGNGPPMDRPVEACAELQRRLRVFCGEMLMPQDNLEQQGFIALSDHLLASKTGCCSYYAVLDGGGSAVLIDAGYPDAALATTSDGGYGTRFLSHGIETLMGDHDIKRIDAVIVTHYHDDHVIGIPYLQKTFGSKVWCYERIAPILSEPWRFNMPCLFPLPVHVDRTFADGEGFTWGGIRFMMHDLPGQTDLHSGISFDLDGRKWLAMGDSARMHGDKLGHGHIIFANRVTGANHLQVAQRMLDIQPDVLLHGHPRRQVGGEGRSDTPVTKQDLLDFQHSAQGLADALEALVADQPERRCRADWVRIDPYRIWLQPGASCDVQLLADNLDRKPIQLEMRFVVPEGMSVESETAVCDLEPGATHASRHRLRFDRTAINSPAIVCVDVTLDGRPLGWLGHAQVWFAGTPC